MRPDRFLLDSDQLELLLAFENCKGLNQLAELMAKDPSVVSRGLQKIAETYPLLVKIRGRWELTPLGRQVNAVTKESIVQQRDLLGTILQNNQLVFSQNSVLIIINAQCGLLDSTQLGRNNSDAEKNISAILKFWRTKKYPVIHIKHISDQPSSIFYRLSKSSDFLPGLEPISDEIVIEKMHSSAFQKTNLDEKLKTIDPSQIILTGFTTNECIDATARDASSLGFSTYVIGDATAMFDIRTPDGKLLKADRLQRLTLSNIHAFYAKVLQTSDVIATPSQA